MFRRIILYTYIIIGSGILFANLYDSIVDVPVWGADIPNSIEITKNYFKRTTPADLFTFFDTILHPVSIMAFFSHWKLFPNTRWYLGTAVILFFLADIFTSMYLIPKNDILFHNASLTDIETLKQTRQQWNVMNWLRSLITLAGVACTCIALYRTTITK